MEEPSEKDGEHGRVNVNENQTIETCILVGKWNEKETWMIMQWYGNQMWPWR